MAHTSYQSTPSAIAAEVRAAFAHEGLSHRSAEQFLTARQRGLGWQEASEAVAAGLAEHYGNREVSSRAG